MKYIFYKTDFFVKVFILILFAYIAQGQKLTITDEKYNEHKEAGDKFFEDEEYFLASQEYHKAVKLKPNEHYILWRLAESYRLFLDYDDAELWYEKLGAHPDHAFPLSLFWLGLMEKIQAKYTEAEATLSTFIKTFQPKTDEDRIKLKEADFEYKGCIYALEQLKKPIKSVNLTLLPSPVNSKKIDAAPMLFYNDSSIVITSSRADAKGSEINMATGESRTDNFRFDKIGDRWERSHNDDNFNIVNTPKDDGAGELTHDKQKYYYTICDPECAIYVSKKVNEKFTKPIKLNKNINASGYWNAQPTVSPTADTMFFVSKRPGGKGQHDIWMSVNKDKTGASEDWGSALNMVNINTPYVEISPFWDDHTNSIYFASNGHIGFGGWDIYHAAGTRRDSIVNIGLPFNSSRDDYYYNLGKDKGYLASNREGGMGEFDIYSFDIHAKESEIGAIPRDSFADAQSVSSVGKLVYNDTQAPVANVSVYLKDQSGEVLKEAITNASGEFRFENLPPDKDYKILIKENDPRIKAIDTKLEKTPAAAASGVPTAPTPVSAENKPAPNEAPKPAPTPVETPAPTLAAEPTPASTASPATPDNNASSPSPTTESNAASASKAPVEKKPAQSASPKSRTKETKEPKAIALENSTVKSKTNNAPSSKAIIVQKFNINGSSLKPSKVFFENVYFDFNNVELSKSAKKAMDALILYYGDNKEIQIEIKAYSDAYGDPAYNKELSKQRGQACFDYLAANGVEQTALLISPLGEDKPVAGSNSFTGRQLNRRVEFSIIGGKKPYQPTAMAYVVEPRMNLYAISRKFNMKVSELREMNGITEPYIQAYSTIRVKRTDEAINIAPATITNLKSGAQEFKFENNQFVPVQTSADNTPPSAGEGEYIVQPQETLFSIAKRNGITVEQLQQLNGLSDNNIKVGQKIKLK
ncbi:MAG: LysM peptidoglycan-binding domain-containing protein [Cytophagales bacterium]|nr:LysM peptidoglycan-binding domain-containing protein [Cytophagales bacterium]